MKIKPEETDKAHYSMNTGPCGCPQILKPAMGHG